MAKPINLGNLLLSLGLVGLGVSFFVPHWTAQRVARIEARARQVAEQLLAVTLELEPIALGDPPAAAHLIEPFVAACREQGVPVSALPAIATDVVVDADEEPRYCFRGKHYYFSVTRQPVPLPPPPGFDPAARRTLEVYAWPRGQLSPGRSAFFIPEVGPAAFTRNLHSNYLGPGDPPAPGIGRPRTGSAIDDRGYRGRDNEHWLLAPD